MTVSKSAAKTAPSKQQKMAVLLWRSEHPKILSEIAAQIEPPVTPPFVSMILSGKRQGRGDQGKKVLKALRKAGAPI